MIDKVISFNVVEFVVNDDIKVILMLHNLFIDVKESRKLLYGEIQRIPRGSRKKICFSCHWYPLECNRTRDSWRDSYSHHFHQKNEQKILARISLSGMVLQRFHLNFGGWLFHDSTGSVYGLIQSKEILNGKGKYFAQKGSSLSQ